MRPVKLPDIAAVSYDEAAIRTKPVKIRLIDGTSPTLATEAFAESMRDRIDAFLSEKDEPYRSLSKDGFPKKLPRIRQEDDVSTSDVEHFDPDEILETVSITKGKTVKRARGDYRTENVGTDEQCWQFAVDRSQYAPDYKSARHSLIEALGQYCSYCESPIFSHLAVEHRLPKHWFPTEAYLWDNFLLACAPCNSSKSNRPDMDRPAKDVRDGESPFFATTFHAIGLLDRPSYIAWPSRYAAGFAANALFPIRYVLEHGELQKKKEKSRTLVRNYAAATADQINEMMDCYRRGLVRIWDGLVYYGEGEKTWAGNNARVVLQPRDTLPGAWKEAFNRVINVTALNRQHGMNGEAAIDRRTEFRTLAMLKALDLKRILSTALRNNLGDAAITEIRLMIRDCAVATGFWGVWMSVFFEDPHVRALIDSAFPGTSSIQWTF